jgi:regulator of cell morphogenesis and NO signaling
MKPLLLFNGKMKLADVLKINHDLLIMLPRFGIEFGFGEKSIDEICKKYNVSTSFFVMVCNVYTYNNYLPDKETIESVDIHSLISYLLASHAYYLKERLPLIESKLNKIADSCESKYGNSLKRFFKQYKKKVVDHFNYEEQTVFPYINNLIIGDKNKLYSIHHFEAIHGNIEDELNDLTSILIKYLPSNIMNKERIVVLSDIFHLTEDLNIHSLIEEKILVPFVELLEKRV